MKKIFISLAILFVFIIYSAGIRHQVPVLKKPSSLIATTAPTGSSTTSGTSSAAATTSTGSSTTTTTTTSGSATGSNSSSNSGTFKDGTYTGSVADAYYGSVQVEVTISAGKITAVKFLQYPDTHATSVVINQQAMPYLEQEAIQAQSAKVQLISGATFTSQAFIQSLNSALSQA
jgi:uncharacterized protein with FMN-binding domain